MPEETLQSELLPEESPEQATEKTRLLRTDYTLSADYSRIAKSEDLIDSREGIIFGVSIG